MQSITANGRHLWFAYTWPIPSTCGRIGPGLDVRADGGYIVAPPSIHPSGRRYIFSIDYAAAPAIAPAWLIQLAQQRPEAKPCEMILGKKHVFLIGKIINALIIPIVENMARLAHMVVLHSRAK